MVLFSCRTGRGVGDPSIESSRVAAAAERNAGKLETIQDANAGQYTEFTSRVPLSFWRV